MGEFIDHLFAGGITYHRLILEHLQRLAQLSTVDGALILTSALELVAFGAKLQAPTWNGKPLLGPDGWGNASGDTFSSQRYGTRHNSAIDFAAACKGSIVFVISQDGPYSGLRLVRRRHSAVLARLHRVYKNITA